MTKKILILTILAIWLGLSLRAQMPGETKFNAVGIGFKQIKESANFGLVFSGPALAYHHYFADDVGKQKLCVENSLGLAVLLSKGIAALDFYLKPVEVSYLFLPDFADRKFRIGPLIKAEYNYNLYPDLQSGFDYWFTNFSLGLNAAYDFEISNSLFNVRLKTSFLGFISRQPAERGPYYYDLGFKYALQHLHTDLEFATISQYNTTGFEIFWRFKKESNLALEYSCSYFGYYEEPEISVIAHNLTLVIGPKR